MKHDTDHRIGRTGCESGLDGDACEPFIVAGMGEPPGRGSRGFTVVELLCAVALMAVVMGLTIPALRSLNRMGSVTRAAEELSRTLELSRVYAMANQTYVRVAFSSVQGKSMVVLPIYSLDGSLDADDAAAMADPSKWGQLNKPLVLDFFWIDDTLDSTSPSTSADLLPSASDIAAFRRLTGGPEFSAFIQFNPNGEARVTKNSTARFIKIGVENQRSGSSNPLIVRLSGTNGTVDILRKENVR